jgi:invasion protein IalB
VQLKKFLIAIAIAAAVAAGAQAQQQPPKAKAPAASPAAAAQKSPASPAAPRPETAQAATPAQPGWNARCSSASREAPLECAMEQTAVLTKTGQLIVLVNIRVPGDTRAPVALIQLPLGLNLPAGAKIQVDEGKSIDLPVQTCEARGCFAGIPIPPDLLTAMKSGKQFKVSFQTLAKETISIPMPLSDFAAAYEKIK